MKQFKQVLVWFLWSSYVLFAQYENSELLDKARDATDSKRWRAAEKIYKQLIAQDAQDVTSLFELSMVYTAIEHYLQAKELLEQVTKLDENHLLAYYNLAKIYTLLGDNSHAVQAYQAVIKIKPLFAPAYFNWGNLLITQQNYDGAKELYRKTLELDEQLIEAYLGLAMAHYYLQERSEAWQYLELFKMYAPQDSRIKYWQDKIKGI